MATGLDVLRWINGNPTSEELKAAIRAYGEIPVDDDIHLLKAQARMLASEHLDEQAPYTPPPSVAAETINRIQQQRRQQEAQQQAQAQEAERVLPPLQRCPFCTGMFEEGQTYKEHLQIHMQAQEAKAKAESAKEIAKEAEETAQEAEQRARTATERAGKGLGKWLRDMLSG